MTEDKKPTPVTGGGNNTKTTERLIFLLAGLVLVSAIATALFNYAESFGFGTLSNLWDSMGDYFFQHIWPTWKFTATIVSVLAFIGIIYNSWQLRAINIEEKKIYDPPLT